jgi:hypothetical protein
MVTITAVAAPLAQAGAPSPAPIPMLQEQDTWGGALPLPGASIFETPVVEGGWSAFAPIDDTRYWTISDRGPTASRR